MLAVDMKGYGESSAPPGGLAVFTAACAFCPSSPSALSFPGAGSEWAALQRGSYTTPPLPSPAMSSVCALWAPGVLLLIC